MVEFFSDGDFRHGLQSAQLKRDGVFGDDVGGFSQLARAARHASPQSMVILGPLLRLAHAEADDSR